jgi:hypothetical protein
LAKVKAVMKYKVLRPMLQKILGYEKADRLMDRAKK